MTSYMSVNYSSFAFWTDGKRDGSLMPNDSGLRKCQCGYYFLQSEAVKLDIPAGDDREFAPHVHTSDLKQAIATTTSEKVELAARRDYWMHLNDSYRKKYCVHREEEDAQTDAKWENEWKQKNPDDRSNFKKLINKLRRIKPQRPPINQNRPFTFPVFQPTTEQAENMERLIDLLLNSTERLHLEYPIELAELYRELGKFDTAIKLINGIKDEDQDSFSRLLLELSIEKTTAPIRYRS
jgi:hypothetical protein